MGRYIDLGEVEDVSSHVTNPENVNQDSARKAWDVMKGSQETLVSDKHKFFYMDDEDVALADDVSVRSAKSVSVFDLDTNPDDEFASILGEFNLESSEQGFSVEQNSMREDARILTDEAINAFLEEIAASKPEAAHQLTPEIEALAKRAMDEVK